MFIDVRGKEVWLRMAERASYLVVECEVQSRKNTEEIVAKFVEHYDTVSCLTTDPAFVVESQAEDSPILFCMTKARKCAFLILGSIEVERSSSGNSDPLESAMQRIRNCIDCCSMSTGISFAIQKVRTEYSLLNG
jgi:hypothetical protein